jgi:hypothetical protein
MRVGENDVGIAGVHLRVELFISLCLDNERMTYVFLDESNLSLSLGINKRLCLVCSFDLVLVSTLQFILLSPPCCCTPLFSVHVLLLGLGVQLFRDRIGRSRKWDRPKSDRLDLGRRCVGKKLGLELVLGRLLSVLISRAWGLTYFRLCNLNGQVPNKDTTPIPVLRRLVGRCIFR